MAAEEADVPDTATAEAEAERGGGREVRKRPVNLNRPPANPQRRCLPMNISYADVTLLVCNRARRRKAVRMMQEVGARQWGLVGGAISTKNLQQLLSKMTVETVDGGKKEHKFWDTQPVPKLGKLILNMV